MDDERLLTLAEIENARERIRRQLLPTPLRGVPEDQVVAEGACAVAAAALRCGLLTPDGRPVAVVVSGGNIDAKHLARLLAAHG
ncbi:MAG TPA: hypothetical protein VLV54_13465 [Thermoanaerobaculia bacterium]|nr:hypothetical protein [Thermoanaerobaculia bacterium]